MNNFDWLNYTKVFFGKNKISILSKELEKMKIKKVLLVYGKGSIKSNGIYQKIQEQLELARVEYIELANVDPNPRITTVEAGKNLCISNGIDFILAVGGGSVIDCVKAISASVFYDGSLWDLMKNENSDIIQKALPFSTVLTIAATGSEMNNRAVISNWETREKIRLVNDNIYPVFSILDPELTYSLPDHQISCGILDAFSHCLEQLFSKENTSIVSDGILLGIMWSLYNISKDIFTDKDNYNLRANLMWASTMALNGISGVGKTGDWAVHSIEHGISGYTDITHADGLSVLFPNWMEYIADENNFDRFKLLSSVFSDKKQIPLNEYSKDNCKHVINLVRDFFKDLKMPSKLSEFGITESNIDLLVDLVFATKKEYIGNIKKLYKNDVKVILKASL